MIALFGKAGVLLGVLASLEMIRRGVIGFRNPNRASRAYLGAATAALVVGALAAMGALQAALLGNDFSIRYVAENHSRSTPFPFNVATAWAALEGSIVLWGLVLAGYAWTVVRKHRDGDDVGSGAIAVIGVVALFFFGVMATVADPFQTLDVVPPDGPGPNPLLQNHIMMAIHPPLLYLGFVGFTVPFAFAVASLAKGVSGSEWLERTHSWSLVAWSFLGAGIVIGGWWSYEVLGWGGFWAWDPVENASFIPWLTATAFIHSAVVERRRGVLRSWNFVLVILTFAMTIFGTFLTRSGVIGSVHAFSQSAIGPVLLGFFAVILVSSLILLGFRAPAVSSPRRLDTMVSREGIFLLNNLVLSTLAVVVLLGTIYPMIVEAISGEQISVGRPFFDRYAVPLSYILLAAMGVGSIAPYRKARPVVVWDRIRGSLAVAALAGALLVVVGVRVGHVVAIVGLAILVVGPVAERLWRQASAVMESQGRTRWEAVRRVVVRDPRFWGGQVAHLGVAILAVGVALYGNLSSEAMVTLRPGETGSALGYEITYLESFQRPEPNRLVTGVRAAVYRDGELVAVMEPRLNQYPNFQQAIGTPAVNTSLARDIYLTIRRLDSDSVILDVQTHPMMYLVWIGGILMSVGGLASFVFRKPERDDLTAAKDHVGSPT